MPAPLNDLIIVAIEYLEQDFEQTRDCIKKTGLPVHYVKREPEGTGSLAEAINRGFKESGAINYNYCWFVTNITFGAEVPEVLRGTLEAMTWTGAVAIHPHFQSDHLFMNLDQGPLVRFAPFIEFTAAMVETKNFALNLLDENMPYWGHDLDWGYRMNQQGKGLIVTMTETVGHTYIRDRKQQMVTRMRKLFRKRTNAGTRLALKKKYGTAWKSIVWPQTAKEIGQFYSEVSAAYITPPHPSRRMDRY